MDEGKGDQHSIYYAYAIILWTHATLDVAFSVCSCVSCTLVLFLDKGYKSSLYTNKWVYTANEYKRALRL
jgi:hypothetical protein